MQTHLAANTICHPLIARRRAIEKAARLLAEKEAAIAAANDETWKKKAGLSRPATAQGRIGARLNGQGTHRGVMRPASAMARMHEQSTAGVSESLRKTFEEHDNRMAALSNQITLDANVDMREAQFLKPNNEIDTPSKQRRATGIGRLLRGLLDSSTAVTVPTTDYEGGKPEVVKMGAEVQPRDHACTVMPQKISKASIEELSRTMDARLEAMIGWAERATDPMAADAKLSDWFGKWLKSYEYEQHGFKSAQVYGEVKMSEIKHSSSLASIENPNRFRTAVVCDIFGRIMPIFGRYKGLMQQIRHEMMTVSLKAYERAREQANKSTCSVCVFGHACICANESQC